MSWRFDSPEGVHDDATLAVWDESVSPAVKVRDYTTEEKAAAQARTDAAAAAAAAAAAREANRVLVKAIITDLQAEKTRTQAVIDKANAQITGADTKDVARAAKRIADAAIDLARFVQGL